MATLRSADTIVARATPPGRAGVAIIRVSGSRVPDIAHQVLGTLPTPRQATLRDFLDTDGQPIDRGLALYFPAPGSFTGEAVLELHAHGSAAVCDWLIERILGCGARLATAGEFTQRAFLNDKLDLAQAEALADLIDSQNRAQARAAQRSLQGAFSAAVEALNAQVTELRLYAEAAIDFPDEDIDLASDPELRRRLDRAIDTAATLERTAIQGRLLRDGVHVVLAGRPNSGKSSLLNTLAGYDAAIVTPVAGTTRDLVREQLNLNGLAIHLVDTAGLRAAPDVVEAAGVQRARAELAVADLVLLVIDASLPADPGIADELPLGVPVIRILNKTDLTGNLPGRTAEPGAIRVSALTGAGIEMLRELILETVGFEAPDEGTLIARQRHLDAIRRVRRHLDAGRRQIDDHGAGELLAEELRETQNALAEIVGEFTTEDLLGRIFASFCIGK